MYLTPSNNNKPNEEVRKVQRMLNSLRYRYNQTWEYLVDDGIYGKKSAAAVKKFQEYRGILPQMTPLGPILGDTTIRYITEEYNHIPQIKAAPGPVITATPGPVITAAPGLILTSAPDSVLTADPVVPKKNNAASYILEFTDVIVDMLSVYDKFLNSEIEYFKSLKTCNPQALKTRFWSLVTSVDPKLKKNKANLFKHLKGFQKDDALYKSKHNKSAKSHQGKIIRELKKFDLITKIERKLQSMGITGEIKINKQSGKPIKIQIKGSQLLTAWSLRELIWDVCSVAEWGDEAWFQRTSKHLMEFFDGFIIGYISSVIAEFFVVGIAAIGGAAISAGWIIVIIAVVAVILASLIGYFLDSRDISFSKLALEGYDEIISLVKIW